MKPARDDKGRLMKGSTANPGGRPKVPEVLRAKGPDACQKLVDIMEGAFHDDKVSPGQAAIAIIDRLYPKPAPEQSKADSDRLKDLADALRGRVANSDAEDDDEEAA